MRAVLRLSSYRRLVAAYALNELAWSVATLALALVVYGRTGSAVGATVFFLSSQFVPAVVSPALVARLDRLAASRVLAVLYALQALAFLALIRVTSHFALVPVLVLAGVGGTVGLAARAIARATTAAVISSKRPVEGGERDLQRRIRGVHHGRADARGVIVLVGGTGAALLANSGIFVAIAVMFVSARDLPGAVSEGEPAAGRVKAAVVLAGKDALIRALLGLQAAALVFFTMSIPVEVVFAQRSLHAGAGGYGALLSAWGAGAVAGSAAYARWRGLPARALIVLELGGAWRWVLGDGGVRPRWRSRSSGPRWAEWLTASRRLLCARRCRSGSAGLDGTDR